ncbi:5'-nucleotidase SurE [Striga asiatica]|uniref:5'-nucleotidase SurE n=1 Tax=Striga asiatica TaxID=4170 RepID=A0A5A7Q1A9_STRAF|nr:5'-nucleotidase SurE [Striga asiatica]
MGQTLRSQRLRRAVDSLRHHFSYVSITWRIMDNRPLPSIAETNTTVTDLWYQSLNFFRHSIDNTFVHFCILFPSQKIHLVNHNHQTPPFLDSPPGNDYFSMIHAPSTFCNLFLQTKGTYNISDKLTRHKDRFTRRLVLNYLFSIKNQSNYVSPHEMLPRLHNAQR